MSMMLAVYAWADDSTLGRNRYYGRRFLQRTIENYHLEDSIIGYPHIGIFLGVNWMFVVNKQDSAIVCYMGKRMASNELPPYTRQERSYSDTISAMFSLLDKPEVSFQYDSTYSISYYYFYVFDPNKFHIFEKNLDMKIDDNTEVSSIVSKVIEYSLLCWMPELYGKKK